MTGPSQAGPPSGLFGLGAVVVVAAVLLLVLGVGPFGRVGWTRRSGSAGGPRVSGAVGPSGGAGRSGGAAEPGDGGPPSGVEPVGSATPASAVHAGPTGVTAYGLPGPEPVQIDPETLDPALRREHERLLVERPLFQHLPYRDTEIGVDFDRVVGGGRLELLVTYLGSRDGAVRDVRRLLARYGDPGTGYVERYERVF
jgi:hypothetical protein